MRPLEPRNNFHEPCHISDERVVMLRGVRTSAVIRQSKPGSELGRYKYCAVSQHIYAAHVLYPTRLQSTRII